MAKFLSGRQRDLSVGIASFTENKTVLQTTGKVGIGTTDAQQHSLFVVGSTNITGDINVGGASTFVGVGTFGDDLYVANQLYVGGVNVSGGASIGQDITTRHLLVTGFSTFTGPIDANGGLDVIGGTNLDRLQVSGISTFANGPVLIGSGTSTGTASQRLQVTGGAYVSGSVGMGTATPREELDVIGDIGVQASGATNRFVIQHNNSLNSLDFVFV